MNNTMRETIYKQTLPSESFIRKPCTVSEQPTELEALTRSPEITVKRKLLGTLTSRATGSVKFNSVFDQHNSLMEESSTSKASF